MKSINLQNSKIVIIAGPTGVGKTGFAIKLAQQFQAQIIGADSMQIYRHMDIGTAKPTSEEQAAIKHHMVDIRDPHQDFDAAAFAQMAGNCIDALIPQGILPMVVGGTGLYIKSLLYGLFQGPSGDATVRKRLKKQAAQEGTATLHARLAKVDPDTAQRLHPNDTARIVRALEVFEISGRSLSVFYQEHGFAHTRYNALQIGLHLPRELLYRSINTRVDVMLDRGLLEEVRNLLDKGYSPDLKTMQSLGYRHMIAYLQGHCDWQETVRTLKRDHRRYAKRQMTWFSAVPDMIWLEPHELEKAADLINGFLNSPH